MMDKVAASSGSGARSTFGCGIMVDAANDLITRVTLLEAKVKLLAFVVEGMIVAFVTALIAYFFKG
jgi:hypothetical protein